MTEQTYVETGVIEVYGEAGHGPRPYEAYPGARAYAEPLAIPPDPATVRIAPVAPAPPVSGTLFY